MGQSLQSQLVSSCQSDQVELCKSILNQDLNLFNYEDDKVSISACLRNWLLIINTLNSRWFVFKDETLN